MRTVMLVPVLVLAAVQGVSAQVVACRLAPSQYVLRGTCLKDSAEPRPEVRLASFWPADSVAILMTTGPQDQPPWRGNMSLPGLELSFEVAREVTGPERSRLVLRTGLFWLLVKEWRETEAGGATLIFGLADRPSATADDVAILNGALASLNSLARWDREDDRDCANDEEGAMSLFCVLSSAIEARMGRYHHRQPALELVRQVLVERWRDRLQGHPIMDFNNHAATTMADLRTVLELALGMARAQAASDR